MLLREIQTIAEARGLSLAEEKGCYVLERVVAERKVFLSRKKLIYRARFRIGEEQKELQFTELLEESGFGFSSGDADLSSGSGFRKETYRAGTGPREGHIEEQSRQFGKQYSYSFDLSSIRKSIEAAARNAGYSFHWKYLL